MTVKQQTKATLRQHRVWVVALAPVWLAATAIFALTDGPSLIVSHPVIRVPHGTPPPSEDVTLPIIAVVVTLIGFAIASAILVVTDLTLHLLPHVITVPTAIWVCAGFLATAILGGSSDALVRAFGAGLGVGVFLFLIALLPGAGIGGGDVKLAAIIAAITAWISLPTLIVAFLLAFTTAGALSIALLALKKINRSTPIPFGPFLIVGAWGAILVGPLVS